MINAVCRQIGLLDMASISFKELANQLEKTYTLHRDLIKGKFSWNEQYLQTAGVFYSFTENNV